MARSWFWLIVVASVAWSGKNVLSAPVAAQSPNEEWCSKTLSTNKTWRFELPMNLSLFPSAAESVGFDTSLVMQLKGEEAQWFAQEWNEIGEGVDWTGQPAEKLTLVKGFALANDASLKKLVTVLAWQDDKLVQIGIVDVSLQHLCYRSLNLLEQSGQEPVEGMFRPISGQTVEDIWQKITTDVFEQPWFWWVIGISVIVALLILIFCVCCCCHCCGCC